MIPVWIHPAFAKLRDADNVPFFDRHTEALWQFGRACGLAFRLVPRPQDAHYRFNHWSRPNLQRLSQTWNARDWWGDSRLSSVYLAVHPNRRDIGIGTHTKDSQGAKLISRINAMRFAQHALWCAMG